MLSVCALRASTLSFLVKGLPGYEKLRTSLCRSFAPSGCRSTSSQAFVVFSILAGASILHCSACLHLLSESQLHSGVISATNSCFEVSAKLHELTTVGIDIGIWVLHLALLQKYRRDSVIASVQGIPGTSLRDLEQN